MVVHLGPQHVVRKLGVVRGIDASKVDLLDPIIERRLIGHVQSITLRIPQNLTLGRSIILHQCTLKLVSNRGHSVIGYETEKEWGRMDSF